MLSCCTLPLVPHRDPHVYVILQLIIPHQQLFTNSHITHTLEVEHATILQGLQILLLLVPGTLDEIHPVAVLWITRVNEIGKGGILVHLVERNRAEKQRLI